MYIHTYTHTYLPIYMHTCMHSCMLTYIYTYMRYMSLELRPPLAVSGGGGLAIGFILPFQVLFIRVQGFRVWSLGVRGFRVELRV